MLGTQDIISILIRNKYAELTQFYTNKNGEAVHNSEDIYEFTPHPLRYSALKCIFKLSALPLSMIVGVIRYSTFGTFKPTWINFTKIFLDKMNEGISKKILHGLPEENTMDQTIPKIVEHVLKQYKAQPELIMQPEPSLASKLTAKINDYIPILSKIENFWVQGGIKYNDEVNKYQGLIKLIYKVIISEAYNVGKKGGKLEIADVKALFPTVNFEEKEANSEELVICEATESETIFNTSEETNSEKNTTESKTIFNTSEETNSEKDTQNTTEGMLKALCAEIRQLYAEHCLAELQALNNPEILKRSCIEDYLTRLLSYSNNTNSNSLDQLTHSEPLDASVHLAANTSTILIDCY